MAANMIGCVIGCVRGCGCLHSQICNEISLFVGRVESVLTKPIQGVC